MSAFIGFGLWLMVTIMVAFGSKSRALEWLGLLVSLGLLPVPFLISGESFIALILALMIVWLVLRTADLMNSSQMLSPLKRWLHLTLVADFITLTPNSNRQTIPWFLVALCFSLLLGIALILTHLDFHSGDQIIIAWLLIALSLVLAFEVANFVFIVIGNIFRVRFQSPNHQPWKSLSISEFWSKRWNSTMNRMLSELVFKKFSKRNSSFALWMSFIISGWIHAYVMWAAVGAFAAVLWGSFFILQPVFIMLERSFKIKNWPVIWRRIWVYSVFILLLPLLSHPLLLLAIE